MNLYLWTTLCYLEFRNSESMKFIYAISLLYLLCRFTFLETFNIDWQTLELILSLPFAFVLIFRKLKALKRPEPLCHG